MFGRKIGMCPMPFHTTSMKIILMGLGRCILYILPIFFHLHIIPLQVVPWVSRPRSRFDPIGESEPFSGCETIYWDSLFFFFFKLNLYLWYTNNFL